MFVFSNVDENVALHMASAPTVEPLVIDTDPEPVAGCDLHLTKLQTKEARELVMEAVEKQEQGRLVCTPVRSKKSSKYLLAFSMAGAQKDNGAALRTATTSCILDVRK